MKKIPFYRLPNGKVFVFLKTREIMAKVSPTTVLVLRPDSQHFDERGKIVPLIEKDQLGLCAPIDIGKYRYEQ